MVKRGLDDVDAAAELPNKVARVADDGENGWTVTRGPQIIDINGRVCQHEVAWPGIVKEESAFQPPTKSKQAPAKQYPFTLDPFQQTAINCLEAGKLGNHSFGRTKPSALANCESVPWKSESSCVAVCNVKL